MALKETDSAQHGCHGKKRIPEKKPEQNWFRDPRSFRAHPCFGPRSVFRASGAIRVTGL
jgi:hypothetical protein